MTLKWLSFLFIAFLSMTAFAQRMVVSEFAFVLDKEDYSRFKNDIPAQWQGTVSKSLGEKQFSEPYQTSIQGIKLDLEYQLQAQSAIHKEGIYPFFAYLLDPRVQIDQISTQDQVRERRGNLVVNVKIAGQCDDITLSYKSNYLPVKGEVQAIAVGGRLKLYLKNFDFSYDSQLWNMNFSKCEGPKGYGEVLAKNMQNFLNDKKQIESFIKIGIEEQLSLSSLEINQKLLQVQSFDPHADVRLNMYPYTLTFGQKGEAILRGLISIEFKKSQVQEVHYVPFANFELNSEGSSKWMLPRELLSLLLKVVYEEDLLRQQLFSQDLPELQGLFESRFNQFFAWPDLMNFSKKTNFLLDIYPYTEPQIQQLAMSGQQLRVKVATHVANQVFFPQQKKYKPYVNFYSQVNANILIDVQQQGLRVRFANSQFKTSYFFDKDYVKNKEPNKYINIEELEERLGQALVKQQLHYQLGPIDLDLWGQLYPTQLNLRGQSVELFYGKKN